MAEHTSGGDPSRAQADPDHQDTAADPRRGRRWAVLVPVVAPAAGLLFTTNVSTAAGTRLPDDRPPQRDRRGGRDDAREGGGRLPPARGEPRPPGPPPRSHPRRREDDPRLRREDERRELRRPVRGDGIGQIVIDPGCDGPCHLSLRYTGGPDRIVTRALSAMATLLAIGYLWLGRKRPSLVS